MLLRFFTSVIFVFVITLAASAATFNVNTTADTNDPTPGDDICGYNFGGYCSLRAAVIEANASSAQDVVVLPAGTFTLTITGANEDGAASGDLDIGNSVVIVGAGQNSTVIQSATSTAGATDRVFDIFASAGSVLLSDLTVRNGRIVTGSTALFGGGIRSLAQLVMQNSNVTNNEIYVNGSGEGYGGGIWSNTSLTLTNCTVTGNKITQPGTAAVSSSGGGIAMYGTANLTTTTISNNQVNVATYGDGAGIAVLGSMNFKMTQGTVTGNILSTGMTALGGGMYFRGGGTIDIKSSLIENNSIPFGSPARGGGIHIFSTASNSRLAVLIDKTTINNNQMTQVGGLSGTGGYGETGGGGLSLQLGFLGGPLLTTITNSTISNNFSSVNGGGINIFNESDYPAGVICTFDMTNSTVSGNRANKHGGAIYGIRKYPTDPNYPPTYSTLNFSTIANNTANADNSGADSGGGIYNKDQVFNLRSSVISDNLLGTGGTAPDFYGVVNSLDYNHIGNMSLTTVTGTLTHNTTGTANLGILQNNGGPTKTQKPNAGSVLINMIPSGVNGCGSSWTLDQRGTTRPTGGNCDKGSVEQ